MAIAWPGTLPAPLRSGLKITPNPDARARATQSGRKEIRRWGKGKGDTLTCTLRLWKNHPQHGDQVAILERFWDRELNFGRNWIDADWLETGLGYTGCYLRLIGYSRIQGTGQLYVDYAVSFEIKAFGLAPAEDSHWLAGIYVQAVHDFSNAAIWVAADLPQTGCSSEWPDGTTLSARNITGARLISEVSRIGNATVSLGVCKTVSPPYAMCRARGAFQSSNNKGTSLIAYDSTATLTPISTVSDKALHCYFTIDTPLVQRIGQGGVAPIFNVQFTNSSVQFFSTGNNDPLIEIPVSLLQTHDDVIGRYVMSMMYRHVDRRLKLFVEGVEVFAGTAPYPLGHYPYDILGPGCNGGRPGALCTLQWHGFIWENVYDERSVQAAIDFFDTL